MDTEPKISASFLKFSPLAAHVFMLLFKFENVKKQNIAHTSNFTFFFFFFYCLAKLVA